MKSPNSKFKKNILYEDQDILVINKPAGVVVNDASSVEGETIQSWFGSHYIENQDYADGWQELVPADFDDSYGSPEDTFKQRRGLVHRLDKNTSGALLLAKNPGALVNLLAQFKQRKTQKKYLSLAHGKFGVEKDTIVLPMARSKSDPTKFAIVEDGRIAETDYQVKQFYSDLDYEQLTKKLGAEIVKDLKKKSRVYQGFSMVECWPKTGRTHQIRVHMSAISHPLVGDSKYVGKKRTKLDKVWCKRHFLHASQLEFTHPRLNSQMKIEASLSDDLQQVLNLLIE